MLFYNVMDSTVLSLVSRQQDHKVADYRSSNWNWAAIFDDLSGNEAGGYEGFGGKNLDSCFLLATTHMLPN